MPFPNVEDIIDHIVRQVFHDRQREDGLPKNFFKLALVSRKFLNPVRRNLYPELDVKGPEHFMLLTDQLRLSPHLAR